MEETLYDTEVEEQQQPDPIPKPKKLKVKDFAAKIKAKYPDYKNVDDLELTNKIISKYPEYKEQVDLTPEVKKKVGSIGLDESSLQAGNSLSTGVGSDEIPKIEMYTTPNGELIEDPFALTEKYNSLKGATKKVPMPSSGKGGQLLTETPDEEKRKDAQGIKESLKVAGIDVDKFSKQIKDVPNELYNIPGFSKEEILQEINDNPQRAERRLATGKWQLGFKKELDNSDLSPEAKDNIWDSVLSIQNNSDIGNYDQQRRGVRELVNTINQYGGENKSKLLRDLAIDRAKTYGKAFDNKFSETAKEDKKSEFLDDDQLLGMQYLEDTQPEVAKGYNAILIDPKKIEGNTFAKHGWEEKMLRITELGIGLQQSHLQEEMNDLQKIAKQQGEPTPEQVEKYSQLELKQQGLNAKLSEAKLKYWSPSYYDREMAAQELLGQKNTGGSYITSKIGQATTNTVEGLQDIAYETFASDEANKIHQLAAVGENMADEAYTYVTQKNSALQNFELKVKPELQQKIDLIKNDSNLSDEEKSDKVYDLLRDNPDEWGRLPIQGGRVNVSPSSMFYSVAGLGAMLVPFMAIEAATGGIGGTGTAGKLLRTFNASMAVSLHETYAAGIREGVPNPMGHAIRVTAINSAALAGAMTPQAIRAMLGTKTAIGELVSKMSDDAINAALKETPAALKKFGKSILGSFKTATKEGGKITAFTTGGEAINTAISGKDIDTEMLAKQALVSTLTFSLGGGLAGIKARYDKINNLQADALVRATTQPELFIEAANQQLKDGNLSVEQFNNIKNNIEKAAEVSKKVPFVGNDGKPLSVNNRAKLLMLKMQEAELKEATTGDVPPNLKEKNDLKLEELNTEIEEVYKNKESNPTPTDVKKENVEAYTVSGVEGGDVVGKEPSAEQQLKDIQDGNVVTFEYKNESEVPDVFKNKISSKGEINGKPYVKVTMAKSLADFHLQEQSTKVEEQTKQPVNEEVKIEIPKPQEEGGVATPEISEVALETKEGETGQPPKKPPIGTDADVYTEDKRTELSFRGLQEVATEFGLNDVTSRERKSDLQLFKDAETEIKKWVDEGFYQKNIETVIKDAAERKPISDTQRVILENHIHAERVKANEIAKQKGVNSKEFKDAVNEIDRITKAAITSRQEAGAALRIPTTANNNTASLADAIIATKESKNVSELTDTETAEVEKQYKAIEDANAKFQEYKAEAEAKFKEYQAKIEMLEASKKTTKGKKTATDLKTEREDIKKSILEKWNKAKNVGIVNNPKEDLLIQLAPDIAKLMRNYYQDGVRQLGEMVDKIHTYLKDLGIGVDASDVQDMIAGKYNQKKLTKNEMVAEIKGLQYEAKALNELKSLMNKEPRNEKEKRKKNERLAEIRKQINVLKKEQGLDQYSDQAKVDRAIAANKAKEEKYKEKLKKGEFEKQPKHKTVYEAKEWQQQNPSLYKKLLDSQAKADQARADFEAGLIENEMKNAGLGDKFRMVAKKSSGTLKQLFASFDLSAIAVQNLPFILTQPKTSAKGLPRSFVYMGSQKQFDRYLTELHNSSYWPIFKDMGLRVTEPKSLLEATREDYFPDRFKAVVKINGKEYGWVNIGGHKYELLDLSKPFERQFTSLGNLLRTVKATTEIDILKSKGITFENSPEEYKTLAKRLNNLTSSSDIPAAYQNEITRTLIWSSRLVAAKLNMLGISDVAALIPGTGVKKGYYRGLGVKSQKISRQQAMAAYDLAKFATSVVALTYLVALMKGGTVNTNPTSNQFMDVEYDDGKSMNLTGGFSSYIAKLFQFANWGKTDKYGVFKPYKGTDPIKESMAFMGSKAPPVTRSLENVVAGKDQFGQDADISTEASKYKMPLAIGQIYDQIQKDGVGALFTEGIPTLIGFNAKDNRNYNTHKFSNDTEKFIIENQVPISMPQKVYTKNGEKMEMTKDEYKDFLNQIDKEIDNITSDIKKNGGYVIRNKEIVQLPYSKLTKEEISEMTKEMITEATAQIRKDKFKTDEETDEYIEKSTIEEILRQTRKVQRQK